MGESSPSSLPQQWWEFRSSGPPMFLAIDAEEPFKAMEVFWKAFANGKAIVEAQLPGGQRMLFDFLEKRCVDLDDASKNYSLRWVDARNQVYSNETVSPPLPPAQEMEDSSPSTLRHQWHQFRCSGLLRAVAIEEERANRILERNEVRILAAAFAEGKAVIEVQFLSGQSALFDFLRKVVVSLDDPSTKRPIRWKDSYHRLFTNAPVFGIGEQEVRRSFAEGTGRRFTITAVQKCDLYCSQLIAFKVKMSLRSFVYGWYGTLVSDVKEAAYGNGAVNINSALLAAGRAHGHGVHISPMSQPYKSAMLADLDKRGECHVLFCTLSLGWQEIIPAGSHQDQPSSIIYDTGVDNKSNPSWYIFWSGMMNSQIVPLYIVSFIKTNPEPAPLSMYDEIRSSLSSLDLQALERCCQKYMKKEISTSQFVDSLCVHGGEHLFQAVAKSIANKC